MINERIKELRTERGITQQQLATELGVSGMTISNYEQGTRKPDSDIIIKAAKYFGVSSDYLLGIINTKDEKNIDVGKSLGLNDFSIDALEISFNENNNIAGEIINNIIKSTAFQRMIDLISEKPLSEKLKADLLNMKIGDIVKMDDEHKAAVLEELFPLYQNEICKLKDFEVEQCINALQRELIVKYVKSLYVYPAEL